MSENLHLKHMQLLDAANYATYAHERRDKCNVLRGWREGIRDAGIRLDLCAADLEYIDRGIDRPMCAGLFLDWEPKAEEYLL
jgi:hypothetical protein